AERAFVRISRAISTAPSRQMSRDSISGRGGSGEELQGGCDAPAVERHARDGQAHLDAAERGGQHQIVEITQMAHPKDLAFPFSKACSERQIEAFENDATERIRVVPFRRYHGRQRAAVFLRIGADDVETPRTYGTPSGFGMLPMSRKHLLQTFVE